MTLQRAAASAALLAVLALAFAGRAAAFQAVPVAGVEARAERLVRSMARGDFAAVEEQFDGTMRAALPASRLERLWGALQAQAGAFQEVGSARTERSDSLETVVLGGRFERAALDFRVVFRPDGRVAGLFVVPAAPPVPPDYSAPAGAPYRAEEVRVRTPGGHVLAGTLTLPAGAAGGVPAVVLVTGSGPQDRDAASAAVPGYRPFRQVADTLSRRGIAVLRLDDRGVGGSGGVGPDVTTADFADDVRAAVAYLRARGEVDPARVGLVGHSEGGVVAPMVAAGDPGIRAVALLAAPSRPGREISMAQNRTLVESIPELTAAQRDSVLAGVPAKLDSLAADNAWLRFWLAHDPAPVARRLRSPVLVLQGATDRQVPASQAAELAAAVRAGGNRDVTARIFPDVNHLLVRDPDGDFNRYAALPSKEVAPEVLGTLADWLAMRLR